MIFKFPNILFVSIVLFGCVSQTAEKHNLSLQTIENEKLPENAVYFLTKHKGIYKNVIFGFSARIPENLTGESSPPPLPQHGFGITLSEDSAIYVNGSYNAMEWKSLDDAIRNEKDYINDAKKTLETKHRFTNLDGLKFVEIKTKYVDKNDKEKVLDNFVGLTRRETERAEIFYELTLETSVERFSEDKKIFEEITKSWKQVQIEN